MHPSGNAKSGRAPVASAAPKSITEGPAVRGLLALARVAVATDTVAGQAVTSRAEPGTLITRVAAAVENAKVIHKSFGTPDVGALLAGFVVEFAKDGGQ